MAVMSRAEAVLCRSAPWRLFAQRAVLPWVLQDVPMSGRVLELGGGSGAMAQTLLRTQPGLDLTVVDLDPEMVAAGRRRLAGTAARVDVADSGALPYADDSFDMVASFIMLHHLVDWHPTITEAVRVLRPGGRLVGYDLTRTSAAVWFHRLDRSQVHLLTESQVRAALVSSGFEPVDVEVARGGHWMRLQAGLPTPPVPMP